MGCSTSGPPPPPPAARPQLTRTLAGLAACPRSQPGHAAPKEGWELSYYVGMFGGFLLAAIGLAYKPDTKYGSDWARWLRERSRMR